ncbi:MAG: 2-oxoacid:acceptor oxidoreductase family protein [Anaerolineales bacterium]|nr:2-oxoacid:acceptor oxidoreductase family protein [Anaerolineales bacterium]
MQTEIIISGFGGQGVLFSGQLLAYAALDAEKHVTWIPSYGPEMRGGTAHCTVIISDKPIGSPIVRFPKAAMVMNLPSFDKYESLVRSGGVLVVNESLVDRTCKREDLDLVLVPATNIADDLGNRRMANLVMLGGLLGRLPVLPLEGLARALEEHIPDRHKHTIPANLQALQKGYELAS